MENYSPEDSAAEAAFELQTETDWLRRAEYDQEAQDEMARDDARYAA